MKFYSLGVIIFLLLMIKATKEPDETKRINDIAFLLLEGETIIKRVDELEKIGKIMEGFGTDLKKTTIPVAAPGSIMFPLMLGVANNNIAHSFDGPPKGFEINKIEFEKRIEREKNGKKRSFARTR